MLFLTTIFLLLAATGYSQESKAASSSSADDTSCTFDDGSKGECVPYFFCIYRKQQDLNNSTRNSTGCKKNLDTCCSIDKSSRVENITTTPKTPTTTVSVGVEETESCTTEDGSKGVCVRYYQCKNKTLNEGGEDVIDIRASSDNECNSYLDICCLNVTSTSEPQPKPKEPERPGCGYRNPDGVGFKITGALDGEAGFGEFPWMVAIILLSPKNKTDPTSEILFLYQCGGSLIHPSVVLTAAHCVTKSEGPFRVRAGEWDTQTEKEIYGYKDRNVSSMDIHKDFHKGTLYFDYAVLFLETPMDLAPNVGLACLPPPMEVTAAGTKCFITGWGKDKFGKQGLYQVILKRIQVPVVERNTCQAALRKTRLGKIFKLHTTFMCAGGEAGKDACKGDGGSPLSCPIAGQKERYVQSGIVAWGIGCGETEVPGVYVDVAYMRNWIDEKVIAKGYDPKVYEWTSEQQDLGELDSAAAE